MILKRSILSLVIVGCIFVLSYQSVAAQEVKTAPPIPTLKSGDEVAVIVTKYGKIKIQLFADVAPKHVENFKKLIKERFYDGLAFHRAVPNLIVQGGDPNTRKDNRESWGMGAPNQPKVEAEFNDRPFVEGTFGAARAADPNSASSQFFLCVRPNPNWDGKYTNYGQIISGIEIVRQMTLLPTEGQKLKEKIVMSKVYLERYRKVIKRPLKTKGRKTKGR